MEEESVLNTWQKNPTSAFCAECTLQRLMSGCRSLLLTWVICAIAGYKHICHSKVYLGDLSILTDGTVTPYNPTMPLPTGYESILFINTLLPARITFLYFSASLL